MLALDGVEDARLLRSSMLVVSVSIEGRPSARTGADVTSEGDALEQARQEKIHQLRNQIWQLENAKDLRWLIVTDDDLDLHGSKARRRMLWQFFCRFDVGRGLSFDAAKARLCWDATTPIPSEAHGVRRWPAVTLHSPETLEKVAAHPELANHSWPPHLRFPVGGA